MKQTKAKLQNSSPKQGMGLHKYIATGGNPADYDGSVGEPQNAKKGHEAQERKTK